MTVIISGDNGVSDVDGSAGTPAIRGTDANTGIFFGSDIIGFSEGGAEAMRIDSSGNVGIGTTSPATRLDIKPATDVPQLYLVQHNADDGWKFQASANGGQLQIFRRTGGSDAERARIDSDGNLQLGYGGSSPTAATAPQGLSLTSSANTALQIYMLKQTQVEAHIGFKSSTDTNFYVGTSGGGGPGGIGAYGVYQQNVTNSWTSVSDERVKTELQPIENALEKVESVRTVTGRFIYDEINGVTRRLPFLIAQDFLTALPEAVDQQDPDKLGLSYSDTIVLAFAAIKELKAINDAQASRIETLEAKVAALEAR